MTYVSTVQVGDVRTLASIAASRGWRSAMPPRQQVRAELLRQHAAENAMGAEARRSKGYKSPNAWLWRDHTEGKRMQLVAEDE